MTEIQKNISEEVEHPMEKASLDERIDDLSQDVVRDAQIKSQFEHDLKITDAIKIYKWAIIWCLCISATVIMEGYDTILMGNFYAFPEFQKRYGKFVGVTSRTQSGYQLTAAWQAALGNGAGIGAFFGAIINGLLVNRFGQKNTVIGGLIFLSCTIFATFFAPRIEILLVGQILCGLPWGVFATSAPAYASEMLPMNLRVYFTSYTNMCFIVGQLIAAGVLRACLRRHDHWAFQIPFALQWVWPAFLVPLLCFAPESPWHLVRQGKHDEALKVLERLQDPSASVDAKQTLATIIYTNNLEKELAVGTSYKDCFKSFELRRTEIACVCFAAQVLCGSPMSSTATYFWEQVGLSANTRYNLNIVSTSLGLIAATFSWVVLMPRLGRRTIYLGGIIGMSTTLMVIGILNKWAGNKHTSTAQASLVLVWKVFFQISAGQLGWAIPAEVIGNVLQPYFMNPKAWNLRGYTGFVWGGTGVIIFVWAFFRLPETKDLTYEELDILFAAKTNARKFKKTQVDAFDKDVTTALHNEYRR